MNEVGTLKELNVKLGDVVREEPFAPHYEVRVDESGDYRLWRLPKGPWGIAVKDSRHDYEIISRASDKPKLWKDMTPEEKGALLLAEFEGRVIEQWQQASGGWVETSYVGCNKLLAFRIRPEQKVETVSQGYKTNIRGKFVTTSSLDHATHVITFNLIDGKPDCASVKMEPLK